MYEEWLPMAVTIEMPSDVFRDTTNDQVFIFSVIFHTLRSVS